MPEDYKMGVYGLKLCYRTQSVVEGTSGKLKFKAPYLRLTEGYIKVLPFEEKYFTSIEKEEKEERKMWNGCTLTISIKTTVL